MCNQNSDRVYRIVSVRCDIYVSVTCSMLCVPCAQLNVFGFCKDGVLSQTQVAFSVLSNVLSIVNILLSETGRSSIFSRAHFELRNAKMILWDAFFKLILWHSFIGNRTHSNVQCRDTSTIQLTCVFVECNGSHLWKVQSLWLWWLYSTVLWSFVPLCPDLSPANTADLWSFLNSVFTRIYDTSRVHIMKIQLLPTT